MKGLDETFHLLMLVFQDRYVKGHPQITSDVRGHFSPIQQTLII